MVTHTHTCTCTRMHTCTHMHTRTRHTHAHIIGRASAPREFVFLFFHEAHTCTHAGPASVPREVTFKVKVHNQKQNPKS